MSVNPNYIMSCEKCNVNSYDLIFLQCENCGHITDSHKELVGENGEKLDEYLEDSMKAREEHATEYGGIKNEYR
mgnify:CR=1 FL=1